MLVGFGTSTHTKRKARPQSLTGEKIKIAPSTQAKFKAGKALKDALN